MVGKVVDIGDIKVDDRLAVKITDQYIQFDTYKQPYRIATDEIARYIFATDTTQTTNAQLPWKNKTTIPKLCHIRDNLYSNYTATMFPKRKNITWEANEQDSDSVAKRDAIINYMAWAVEQPSFKHELDKAIMDYIDEGNCFGTVEWTDERTLQEDGTTQTGYVGPSIRRISPKDIVMNPTAPAFSKSPKIIRSLLSKGEVKKILLSMSNDENRQEYEELWAYLQNMREIANNIGITADRDAQFNIAGFGSFQNYLLSDYMEILTFYGDIYDDENDEFLENYVITVVDRHKLLGKKPNPSYFGTAPIFHVPWRKRQDNLWGMGPLDNLVGMQYRLDHVENMRADVVDLTTYPVQKIKGFVADYTWQPGEKIFVETDGDVELLQPEVSVLNAQFELTQLEAKMEEMAGAPKEAMGFRTPGEKTKYEVQRLENAASRVFQNKIKQFEEQFVEPLLNAMLELARRNLSDAQVIKVFDDEQKVSTFQTLTAQDITGVGRIRPIAARHFAEQAELIQNLTNLAGSGLWPLVQPHVSSIQLSKFLESVFDVQQYNIFGPPFIGLAEQADAQKFAHVLEEQVLMAAATATGMNGDYDLSQLMQQPNPMEQPQGPQPTAPQAEQPMPEAAQAGPQTPFNLKSQPAPTATPGGLLGTQ